MDTWALLLVAGLVALVAFFLSGGKKQKGGNDNATPAPKTIQRGPPALTAKFQDFPLTEKIELNESTYRLKFALPTPEHSLGLPIGKHMRLKYYDEEDEDDVTRPYTPISSDDDLGFFELMIKVYEDGQMTEHLKEMKVGDTIKAAGPIGKVEYISPGEIKFKEKGQLVSKKIKKIGMIAYGAGITAMLQIIREIAKHDEDNTEISLIFANDTEENMLCRAEIEQCAEMKNVSVHYTLDRADEKWTGSTGAVTAEMIQAHLPPPADDTIVLMCGPPSMIRLAEKGLKGLDYPENQFFRF